MERTFLLFLLEVTAKATTIVGATALVCWLFRRASAALRHFLWAIALAGALALPALALLMPDWRVTVLPAASGEPIVAPTGGIEPPSAAADTARDSDPSVPSFEARRPPGRSEAPRYPEATAAPVTVADRPIANPGQPTTRSFDRQMIAFLVLTLWIAGAVTAVGRLLAGHAHLWWIERHADPITDPLWAELARRAAEELRCPAPDGRRTTRLSAIRLLRCRRPTMPVCWGVRRPSLLLPSDADSWTVERRRIVLLHELAHAKRRDCLTQALAQMAIALHWFNPLVWLAARRLRTERERACDDLVLASGASAPDYADHLLDIARAFRTAGCPSWAAVAMARPSQLEGRLLAILDRQRDRRALTRPAGASASALAVAMVGTLAAVQPAPAPVPTPARPASQAGATIRPHLRPPDGRRATTAAVIQGDRPMPVPAPLPAPRPMAAPLPADREGLVGGPSALSGAVPRNHPVEIEGIAADAAFPDGAEAIPLQKSRTRIPKIAGTDDRPEADPKIVAALATALKDQNADVRRQAASTLANLRSPHAVDALVAAAADADREVRALAVHAISQHRSDAVTQALVRALKDDDAEVRRAAMHGVARWRDPKYIDVFIDASRSGDREVRTLAVYTLSALGDARGLPALVAAMKDADGAVRQAAIHGVARLRDPQQIDVLTAALKDEDPQVRAAAAHGLAQTRDARAVPGLVVALKDASAAVRWHAAHALGQIGDARAVDPLVAALKDSEDEVREIAVNALGQIGRRAGARERE